VGSSESGDAAGQIPLPPLLTLDGAVPLVARAEPWSELEAAWAATTSGARRVVLVAGEAGAGKTRLLTEFARTLHERGAGVLYGTCSEEQTMPYQPFAEAIDQVLSVGDAAELPQVGAALADLTRLVPWRAAALGVPEPAGGGDPDAERARLFRAVTAAIDDLAGRMPLLIVLDDLHWARRPTIDLLTQVVRAQSLASVMIVGSYRSTPLDIGDPLRSALPELRRLPGVTRLHLAELDAAGVADFVAAAAGHPVAAGLGGIVDVLVRQTDGNAFLLVELWLHLTETGHLQHQHGRYVVTRRPTEIGSPEGVREVVAARLARLDAPTRELLETASVIGPTFSASLLAASADTTVEAALSTLDVTVRARLVDDDEAGTFRFAHELIRRSIYDGLGVAERRRRHRAVALALGGVIEAVAEHARHLLAAVPLVEPRLAVAAATNAADAAAEAVAYDDAVHFLEAALAVATDGRAELLLRAAHAMMRSGDAAGAKQRCLEAHDLARRGGDSPLQIAAALAYGDASWRNTRDVDVAAALLRGALPLAPDETMRVHIQAALTRVLAIGGEDEAARVLGEDALRSARQLDDTDVLGAALDALSCASWTPQTLTRQLGYMREAIDTARSGGDVEWESLAISKLLYGEITAGDFAATRQTAKRHREVANLVGQPLSLVLDHQASALLALGEGRFVDAEGFAEAADALTQTLSDAPPGGYGVQLFSIRREQGRLDEARPVVEAVARLDQQRGAWRPALAVMYAELGLVEEAAAELAVLTADRLAAVPRDALWVGALSYLADACRLVGDKQAAAAVYDEMVAWRGLVVQVGYLLAAHGAVDRYLGELAAVLGWEREAEIHFEAALRLDDSTGMAVWSAHSQLAFGRFLAARGRPADAERAAGLLAAALAAAEHVGLPGIAAAVRSVTGGSSERTGTEAGLTEREVAVVTLVAEGCSNREIGARLHISQHTAANHVRSILMKTACANRTEVATWAMRRGLTG